MIIINYSAFNLQLSCSCLWYFALLISLRKRRLSADTKHSLSGGKCGKNPFFTPKCSPNVSPVSWGRFEIFSLDFRCDHPRFQHQWVGEILQSSSCSPSMVNAASRTFTSFTRYASERQELWLRTFALTTRLVWYTYLYNLCYQPRKGYAFCTLWDQLLLPVNTIRVRVHTVGVPCVDASTIVSCSSAVVCVLARRYPRWSIRSWVSLVIKSIVQHPRSLRRQCINAFNSF